MKQKILIFLLFIVGVANAQTFTTPTVEFYGKVLTSSFAVGGTADVTGNLTAFLDETVNGASLSDLRVNDILWDQSGNIWEIAAINSSGFITSNVDLWKIRGNSTLPASNCAVSKYVANNQLLLPPTVSNSGITPKMLSEILVHNFLKIQDALNNLGGIMVSDSLWTDGTDIFHRNVNGVIDSVLAGSGAADLDSIISFVFVDSVATITNENNETLAATIPFQKLLEDSDVVRFPDTLSTIATKADLTIGGTFPSDVAAGSGGVPLQDEYYLSKNNVYGMSEGLRRKRIY